MLPRIYVYKITFVDQPYWYWGIHKEKKFNEYYMGSPCTNKRYWRLYKPEKKIIQVFDYSDSGWSQAREKEMGLIRPDLNNPLCLNAACGCIPSLGVLAKRWGDEEQRKLQSHLFKQKWQDPEFRDTVTRSLSKGMEARWKDEEYRNKVSNIRKERWKDGEYRDKLLKKRGSPVVILETLTGVVTEFPSLRRARAFYSIGGGTLAKLVSGILSEYKGLKVLKSPEECMKVKQSGSSPAGPIPNP